MPVRELCRIYGISRKTGYKWRDRFVEQGQSGLQDRSRAPRRSPQAIGEQVATAIVGLRDHYPRWGARTIRHKLKEEQPEVVWPAASSIHELLKREGRVIAARRRQRTPPYSQPLAHAEAPNQVWSADFKGWFRTGDGERIDPLTVTDARSRYLLCCRACEKTDGPHVRGMLEAVFREYGVPEAIRTDNGAPFASRAPGGLSRLAMWWLRLGIRHERITPGCPQQNGRHERMHRTLKQETAKPPRANRRRQQEAFVEFQQMYNHERPHQGLEGRTPASVYTPSPRLYPARLPELVYPGGVQMRRISQQGSLKWRCERTYLSEVFGHEWVGLLETEEEFFEVYYGPLLIGWFDGRSHVFAPEQPRRRANQVAGNA
jgi:transposase InsO family protein